MRYVSACQNLKFVPSFKINYFAQTTIVKDVMFFLLKITRIFAGSLESAYWLLRGTRSFLGNGAFDRFMINRPSLSCIHWLDFAYRMMWRHFTTSRGSLWTMFMTSFSEFWSGANGAELWEINEARIGLNQKSPLYYQYLPYSVEAGFLHKKESHSYFRNEIKPWKTASIKKNVLRLYFFRKYTCDHTDNKRKVSAVEYKRNDNSKLQQSLFLNPHEAVM